MINRRMRKPRAVALAAVLAACCYCGVALADDANVDPNSIEAKIAKFLQGFYGTMDVSFDDTTKGMSGMQAYHYGPPNALGVYPTTGIKLNANGQPGPLGAVGWMPALSSNKSGLGYRGDHPIKDSETAFVYQIEASFAVTATSGVRTSYTAQTNSVGGTIGSGDTYLGFANKNWGAVKAGVTYAPYKKSTDRMNPFSGMLGDYAVVMGNTGGDNRVEFGTRLEHAIWYESPRVQGFSFDFLFSPGQNRTTDNVIQSAGSSDCNGGNVPGSGNLPLNCDDGGFGNAFSLDAKFETQHFYATAAWEIHKSVNRNSDGIGSNNPIYGNLLGAATVNSPGLLDPNYLTLVGGGVPTTASCAGLGNFICSPAGYQFAYDGGTAPYLNDIADEQAMKVGVQYLFDMGLTVSAIFERMTRNVPAALEFQNERQRNGSWIALTQDITPVDNLSFGWAHASTTPGDPGGQHNYNPNSTHDTADMYTVAYKRRIDKQLYWYVDAAETFNRGNAHYDLGAGGRALTTDCHDGTNYTYVDYSSAGPTTWGGCKPVGISAGVNYKF